MPNYWSLPEGEWYDTAQERWWGPPCACIRAGLDVACSPSGGVLGFTAGDVRRMYSGAVPQWVKDFFRDAEVVRPDKAAPGVGFTFKRARKKAEPFDRMPDDAQLWL